MRGLTIEQLNKHIWEGWTVSNFIEELSIMLELSKLNRIEYERITKDKESVKKWCMENQPYYKKHIPEVVKYFCDKLNITQ